VPRPTSPDKRNAEGLSETSIVRVARTIVDQGGLRALTMRRLADDLHVALGATYHYVPSRQALIRLVALDIFDDFELPDRSRGLWTERVFDCIVRFRDLVGRYPGLATEIARDPIGLAPTSLQTFLMETFAEAGLSPNDQATVITALYFFASGATLPLDAPGSDPAVVAFVDNHFELGLRMIISSAEVLRTRTD